MPIPRAPRSPHKASETDATIWRMSHTSTSDTHRYRRDVSGQSLESEIHYDDHLGRTEPCHQDVVPPNRAEVHVSPTSTLDPPTVVTPSAANAPLPAKSQVRIRCETRTASKDPAKRKPTRSTQRALSPEDRALQRHDATEYTSALHRCEDRLVQEALRAQRQEAKARVQSAQRRKEVLSYYAAVSRDNGGFVPQIPEVKRKRVPKPAVVPHIDRPTYRKAYDISHQSHVAATTSTKSESRTAVSTHQEDRGSEEPGRVIRNSVQQARTVPTVQHPTVTVSSDILPQSANTADANTGLNYLVTSAVAASGTDHHVDDGHHEDAVQQQNASFAEASTLAILPSRERSVVSYPSSSLQHYDALLPQRVSYGRDPLPMPTWEGGGDGYEHYGPTGLIVNTPIRPLDGALRIDDMLVVRTLRKPLPMPIRDEFTPRAVATGYFDRRQVLSIGEVDTYMKYCAKKRWFHYMKIETVASNLRRDRNRRLIHACVRGWAEATRRRRHNQDIATKSHIRSLTQQWRVAADEKRLSHVADAHHRSHLIRTSLTRWSRLLHLAQCGARYLNERTLPNQRRRVLTIWREQAAAARYHRVDQLGGAFQRWKQRAAAKTHRLQDGGDDPLLRRSALEHLAGLQLRRVFGKWKTRLLERQVAGVADDQCTFMRKLRCFERWKHTSQDNKLERLSPNKEID